MGRILAIGEVGRLARKAAQKGDAATLGKITQAVAAAAANETHSVNQMVVCIAFDELCTTRTTSSRQYGKLPITLGGLAGSQN